MIKEISATCYIIGKAAVPSSTVNSLCIMSFRAIYKTCSVGVRNHDKLCAAITSPSKWIYWKTSGPIMKGKQ